MIYRAQNIPGPDAYAFALSQPFVTDFHRRILSAQRHADKFFMYIDEMVGATNAMSFRTINSQYGRLGHQVADLLDIRPATYSPTSTRRLWTTALAEGGRRGPGNTWYWQMYPEVAAGIDRLGWNDR